METTNSNVNQGYANHRKGSLAEKAHKVFDANPDLERGKMLAKFVKLGTTENTAAVWYTLLRNDTFGKHKKAAASPAKVSRATKASTKTAKRTTTKRRRAVK